MDELEELMNRADPIGQLPAETVDASGLMARSIATQGATAPVATRARARRSRKWLGVLVAGLVLVPSTAVAADRIMARTGEHRVATTENDTSEVINVCAPDFNHYVHSLPHPTDPAPAGMSWDQIADIVAVRESSPDCRPGGRGAETFATAIRDDFYMYANSVFICRAVRDHDHGDNHAAMANARQFATMLERTNQLGAWGDDGWKSDRQAALNGDWKHLRAYNAANGADPCP